MDPLDPSDDYMILGVDKYDSTDKLLYIYPTIASTRINIYDKLDKLKQIEIYNISGQLVSSTNKANDFIDINNLSSGIYIVKLFTSQHYKNIRIVKK